MPNALWHQNVNTSAIIPKHEFKHSIIVLTSFINYLLYQVHICILSCFLMFWLFSVFLPFPSHEIIILYHSSNV